MITEYLQAAMRHARYEFLPTDRLYYGELEGFQGVYASALNLEDCRNELLSTLEDWVLFSLNKNLPLPVVDNVSLEVKELV